MSGVLLSPTNTKRSQLSHTLLVFFVLDSFADQPSSLSYNHNNHDRKDDLVHVDLISHHVIGRDWDQDAKNGESVIPLLSWRGLEAQQLVEQCADSKKHREVIT